MKCSFDFDGTLSEEIVQEYAKELLAKGVEVWVVTTRWDENHKHKYTLNPTIDDLWEVVDKLGIPRHHVRFTCMEWKQKYLDGTNFVWHLDDNEEEYRIVRQNGCNVPIVLVTSHTWRNKCDKLLEEYLNATKNGKQKQD